MTTKPAAKKPKPLDEMRWVIVDTTGKIELAPSLKVARNWAWGLPRRVVRVRIQEITHGQK